MTKILDLGCGKRKKKGAVGIDISKDTDADVIHDLDSFPYPFSDNEFNYVYADNIIEHLDDVIKVLEELYRITKDGATTKIIVPFFRSVYASIDPTHRHFFTSRSFDYFDSQNEFSRFYKYSKCHFKVEKVIFDENIRHKFLGEIVKYFANKHKFFYESRLSYLYPLNTLTFYLRTVKGQQ